MTKLSSGRVPRLSMHDAWRLDRPRPPGAFDPAGPLHENDMAQAVAAIGSRADYRVTPLHTLAGLARALDVEAVLVKDEAARFGHGGVKALGAPYALARLLADEPRPAAACVAVAATDGNHGLALAWAASEAGCRARIFVGASVDEKRIARIRAVGGEIEMVAGTYDDAVLAAEAAARDAGVLLVTDTDYRGDLPVTRAIMAGYSMVASELAGQTDLRAVTHVFLQCGVGGVAAAVVAGLRRTMGAALPKVVAVEPVRAACVLESLAAGRPVRVAGDLHTRMLGLSCGEPSLPAWQLLRDTAFAAMTVGEADARRIQDALQAGVGGDRPLDCGDTGVAGIAGLCVAAEDGEARRHLGLDRESRVLLLNTEGAHDSLDGGGADGGGGMAWC